MIRTKRGLAIPVIGACVALFGCQPDLEVSMTSDPSYSEGQEIAASVSIEVANTGSAAAPGTQDAGDNGYMVDIVLSSDNSVPVAFAVVPSPYAFQEDMLLEGGRVSITATVASGATQTYGAASPPFDVTGLIPPGAPSPAFLCAVVDPGQKIGESDEGNNTFCGEIEITPAKPDLVVSFSANEAYAVGEEVAGSIEILVTNQGFADAAGTDALPSDGYMVDLVLSQDASVPVVFAAVPAPYSFQEDMLLLGGRLSITVTLAPGASNTYSQAAPPFDVTGPMPAGAPQGVHLCAVVDPGQKIDELDETNNTFCAAISIK